MNTEQRLRFEARHFVSVFAEYNAQLNRYIAKHDAPQGQWTESVLKEYNARFEGYQSALEDRQGEAVATLRIQEWGTYGHEYTLTLDCMESDDPASLSKLALKIDLGEHKLFTSPQPAQLEDNNYHDAYRSAMDRAYAAEKEVHELKRINSNLVRALSEEYNGQTHMGEPVLPAQPDPLSIGTAQKEYDECMVEGEEPDPIERLRAFCSFAMEPQDWLDVEKFFNDVIAERADQWNAAIEAVITMIKKQLDEISPLNVMLRQDLRLFIKEINKLRKGA